MDFYIDIDVRTSKIYIAPRVQSKEHTYLIYFEQRYQAEAWLKKLVAKLIEPPQHMSSQYQLIEKKEDELGQLFIYKTL